MSTKIQKWGNSLAVRLPKALTERLKIRIGSKVSFVAKATSFEVKPENNISFKYDLKELVSKITHKNRHAEFDWGKRKGKEIW